MINRTAKIHGHDFTGVRYSYQDLRDLYRSQCGTNENCSFRTIAHVGEDHFVVIVKVTDEEVTYLETSKGASGEVFTIGREQFMESWQVGGGEGYLIVPAELSIESKRISDALAQEIRGAFLCIWCFTFLIVALTVASIALSYVSPTLGKILGYAAMVAGVIGIIGSLTSWVVQGAKMVFSQIVQQGVLQTVKQGILAIGKILVAPIHYAGRFIQNGFAFIKEGFSKGLAKMGQGLSNLKNFLLNPKGLPVVDAFGHNILGTNGQILRHFSIEQIIARQVVAAGINYTVSKGLEGLGLNPVIARLGGAFLGSGFLGIGAETTSFIKSGLQGLLLKGVSEMGLHLDLPPPVTMTCFFGNETEVR